MKKIACLLTILLAFSLNAEEVESGRPVKIFTVNKKKVTDNRSFPGKVRAGKSVDLGFNVPGELIMIDAKEGQLVKKGDVIARVDATDYRNNLDAARARLRELQQNYSRTVALRKQNVVPQAKLDEVAAALDANKANVRIIEKRLQDTRLKAPFSGIIAKRYLENHTQVMSMKPVVRLQNISKVEIEIQVPESLMIHGAEKLFNSATVTFDAMPDKEFSVSLHEYSVEADPFTQTYTVVLAMDSVSDCRILPGMTAKVDVSTELEKESVIYIPSTALFSDNSGNSYIWVVDKFNKANKKKVIAGEIKQQGVAIKSEIADGTAIIAAGVKMVSEGMVVRDLNAGGK
ncbi:MAG: efflux RND transporter periplasmic adaptor subunit [Gammaproteobacteria bacterium]|nr:MAG: efflux RND transporter periplasmic adaptor subunit [Gammaproteobacteria bacterium]